MATLPIAPAGIEPAFWIEESSQAPVHPTRELLEKSPLYSEELGVDLARGGEGAYFQWFLASLLYGGRISETIAARTFRAFAAEKLTAPRPILEAGRDFLVNPLMRRGGYVRYDNRKADQIIRACRTLIDVYGGGVTGLHDAAANPADLEARVTGFYGIGPMTANIFLRELRPFWSKADPAPLPVVADLAGVLGLELTGYDRKQLTFVRVEAGLLRHRRQLEWRIGAPLADGRD